MTDSHSHSHQNEIDDVAAVLVQSGTEFDGFVRYGRNGYEFAGYYGGYAPNPLTEVQQAAIVQLLRLYLMDDEWQGVAEVDAGTYWFYYNDVSSHAEDIRLVSVSFTVKPVK